MRLAVRPAFGGRRALLIDVSAGGVGLLLADPLEPGAALAMQLSAPGVEARPAASGALSPLQSAVGRPVALLAREAGGIRLPRPEAARSPGGAGVAGRLRIRAAAQRGRTARGTPAHLRDVIRRPRDGALYRANAAGCNRVMRGA